MLTSFSHKENIPFHNPDGTPMQMTKASFTVEVRQEDGDTLEDVKSTLAKEVSWYREYLKDTPTLSDEQEALTQKHKALITDLAKTLADHIGKDKVKAIYNTHNYVK